MDQITEFVLTLTVLFYLWRFLIALVEMRDHARGQMDTYEASDE